MATEQTSEADPEIVAISRVHAALRDLDPEAQRRVVDYVSQKLRLGIRSRGVATVTSEDTDLGEEIGPVNRVSEEDPVDSGTGDGLEGISPAAKKWMKRSGFSSDQLSTLFSLGIDEIDLVAKKVPGKSKRDKTRSVILLKGIASYLGTGVPRVTYEQIREAATHYGAFDSPNFAKYLRTMASDVSGTKESGFTVTARGLSDATELVRTLLGNQG